jgi:hypothetical protein
MDVAEMETDNDTKNQVKTIIKGPPGFEPETYRSAVDCSTTELWTLGCLLDKFLLDHLLGHCFYLGKSGHPS